MNQTIYYEKKELCINCKKEFKTIKVRPSYISSEGIEKDLEPIYRNKEIKAYYYNVKSCKHCGFSYSDSFSKYFPPNTRELIDKVITSNWVEREGNMERDIKKAEEMYLLSYVCSKLKKERPSLIAGLCLRLSWIYKEKNDDKNLTKWRNEACEYYKNSYSEGDFEGTSEVTVLYIIGELNKLLGNYSEARRYFSIIIQRQSEFKEQTIVNLAKDEWQEMKENNEIKYG